MVSRRTFLVGGASTLALAACGGGTSEPSGGSNPTAAPGGGKEYALGAGFANGRTTPSVLVPGIPQRLPLVLFDVDAGAPLREGGPQSFEVSVVRGTEIVATSSVSRHADAIPTPYFPLVFTPPDAGDYEVRAAFSKAPVPFRVGTRDTVKLVQVGDPLRPVVTPTTDNARGVTPICTRSPKPCPFHTVTLTDALAAKRPTLLAVTTPGFCQTAICGPVLELLIEIAPKYPNVQIVHAEVYVDPNTKTGGAPKTTDTIATYGLAYEPSFFAAGADGAVKARLDFTWDRAELETAITSAL